MSQATDQAVKWVQDNFAGKGNQRVLGPYNIPADVEDSLGNITIKKWEGLELTGKGYDGQVTKGGITGLDSEFFEKQGIHLSKGEMEEVIEKLHARTKDQASGFSNDDFTAFAKTVIAEDYYKDRNYNQLNPALSAYVMDMSFHRGDPATLWALHNAAVQVNGTNEWQLGGSKVQINGLTPDPVAGLSKGAPDYQAWKSYYSQGLSDPQMINAINDAFKKDPQAFVNRFLDNRNKHYDLDIAYDKKVRAETQGRGREEDGIKFGVDGTDREKFRAGWTNRTESFRPGGDSTALAEAQKIDMPRVNAPLPVKTHTSSGPSRVTSAERMVSDAAGGTPRRPGETDQQYQERQNGLTAMIANLNKTDPTMAALIAFMCVAFGLIKGQDAEEMMAVFNEGHDAEHPGRVSADNLGHGYQRKTFAQEAVDAPDAWNKVWTMDPKDPRFADAQKALMALTPSAAARVLADPTGKLTITQEVRGTGDKSYANLIFKDTNGNLQCLPVVTGGRGNGSIPGASTGTGPGTVDPRYPNAGAIANYTITGYRQRDDNLGKFSFDILNNGNDSVAGTDRGLFRFHVGSGTGLASLGCYHVSEKQGGYFEQQFKAKGDQTLQIMPSMDNNNVLVQEAAKLRGATVTRTNDNSPASLLGYSVTDPNRSIGPGTGPGSVAQVNVGPVTPASRAQAQKDQLAARNPASAAINYAALPNDAFAARSLTLARTDAIKASLDPNKPTIVLDSGHGVGCDCGACRNGQKESELVRSYSAELKKQLQDRGFNVVDTNDVLPKDWGNPANGETGKFERTTRKEVAQRLNASGFLSIHADQAGAATSGTTMYYYNNPALANALSGSVRGNGAKRDTTTAHGELGVLRTHANMDSALAEIGNMDNDRDLHNMNDHNWVRDQASKMADAMKARYNPNGETVAKEKEGKKREGDLTAIDKSKLPLDKPGSVLPHEIQAPAAQLAIA